MKWFPGPVQDAIAAAKHEQKIFLVFVEGKDETSKNMATKIMEDHISKPIDESCVSIKLLTDSEPFRQFSQIYPVIIVPSMFLIGNNGIPLEVIAGSENQEELVNKVLKAIELHQSKLSATGASISSTSGVSTSGSSSGQVGVKPITQSQGEENVQEISVASVSSLPSTKEAEPEDVVHQNRDNESEEATAHIQLQEKIERAEQLVAERRRIREKEEKEAEKQRELEHRRVSREMQKAREQMKEKELADWAKQRQREKQEEKAARDRVLAQIAQDKADRAAKFQYSGSSPPPVEGASNQPTPNSVRQRSPQKNASDSHVARIQFRFPNSETASHDFSSNSTLNDVIKHVKQVIRPGFTNFSLATSFPRRHFSKTDLSRTLKDLDLSPSAVLLVLPISAVNPMNHSNVGGGVWAIIWTLLSPFTLFWNFIYSFIFGSGSQRSVPVQDAGDASSNSSGQQNPDPSVTKPESNTKPTGNSSRYRKDGNIHRLSNESSNDDEDGTWNGNSTQQM